MLRVEIHYDPNADSVAAGLLQSKIWQVADKSDLDVEVVLKEEEG
jgi:hypothetical protein